MSATSETTSDAATVTLADGRTLVAGGRNVDGALTSAVVILEVVRNQRTPIGDMVAPRAGHTATLLPDGRVLIAGGSTLDELSRDVELFDPVSGVSTLAGALTTPRAGHAAATLPDRTVLIVGGISVDGSALSSAEIFDVESGSVRALAATMSTARHQASATTLIDGRVLVAGGNDGVQDLASGEMFSPWTEAFGALDPESHLSVPRHGHTALLLPHNNAVLIAGGRSNGVAIADADLFLPAEFPDPYSYGMGRFVTAAAMNVARAGAVSGPAGDHGYAVVMGGGSSEAEAYRYATLKTDKDDYAPGERATITGSGWQPRETVRLVFQEDPAVHEDYVINVVADDDGNIDWGEWAPEWHDLNVRFYLSASDSRSRAQITFTDGLPQGVTLNPNSVSVVAGENANYDVAVAMGGNSDPCRITLEVTSVLPNGVTASFNNNPIDAGKPGFTRTLTLETNDGQPTPPGTYQFTVRATRAADCQGNAASPTNTGTLIVTGSTTTLSVGSAQGTYGGLVTLSATLTADGAGVGNQPVSFALHGTSVGNATTDGNGVAWLENVSLAGIDAGTYSTGVTASFAGDATYLGSTAIGTLTVDQADATVNVTGYTGTYDGDAHGATGSATGVKGESLMSFLDVGESFTNVPGGTAHWSFNSPNYKPESGDVAITIAKADATVTVTGYTGTYDGDAHGATGSASGAKNESLDTLLDLGASFTDVPGGSAAWTFAGNNNYNAISGTAAIVIDKADAVVSVEGYTGTYDGDAHRATGSATGVKGESLMSFLDLGESFTNVPGGTAHWSFNSPNYNPQSGDVAITIAKADATVTVTGYTGTYDGDAHGATGSATGVKGESLAELLDLGTSFTDVPGGTALWKFAGNDNYNAAEGTAAIVISKADAVIHVYGYTGTYDGNAHGATGSAKGVKNESLDTLLNLGTSFTDAPGGTATWKFAGNGNYNAAEGTAAIVISKADAVIHVYGYTGTYDGNSHAATGSAKGVNGESLDALLSLGASFTEVPGGSAAWTFAGNNNYNATSGTAAIVINKADAVIHVYGYSGSYDGKPHSATGSATGVKGEDLSSFLNLGASFTDVPGGTATWRFAGNGNYEDESGSVQIVIEPWQLTGFYAPVSMGPSVVNTVKGGSTVPLKFNLYTSGGGTELTSVGDVKSFQVFTAACDAITWEDPVEFTTSGGTNLRYDSTGRQFVQNWQTPKGGGQCYLVVMTARDGSQLTARFKTK
jgi:hypothetical protein